MKKLAIICVPLVLLFLAMPGWAAFKLTDNLSLILYYGRDQNEEKIGSELITTYTSYPKIGFRCQFPGSLIITPIYERKYKEDRLTPHLVEQITETTILSLSKKLGKLNYVGDLNLSGHYKFTNFVNQLNKEANQQSEETLLRIVAKPSYHWRWTGEYIIRNTNKVYSQGGSQSWIPRLELYQKVSRKTSLAYGYKQETITYLPKPSKTYVKNIPSIKIWRTLTDKLRFYAMVQLTSQDKIEAGQSTHEKTTTETLGRCDYKITKKWRIMGQYKVTNTKTQTGDGEQSVDEETTTETLVKSRYKITDTWNIMGQYKVIGAKKNVSNDRSISTVELGYTWKFNKKILGATIRINPLIGYEYTDYFSKEKDDSDLGRFYFKVRTTY